MNPPAVITSTLRLHRNVFKHKVYKIWLKITNFLVVVVKIIVFGALYHLGPNTHY